MKSQLHLKKTIITVLFAVISAATFAQTGKISGTVSDKKTGETLIGVTVKVKGTPKGMGTDVDGKYSLAGLSAGKYTLTFQYVGYNTKEISDVEVTAGKSTLFNVILEEAGGEALNEVVIQGSFKKESTNALYSMQKNSIRISDGISAQVITRSPDKNTGEVLKRVSGTSIQDNRFIVVRGLSERYNVTMLNNAVLPSSEPDKKAFSFDVIPSNLIDNIVISKTATPDLPGDFAGGVIQITTKDFPDEKMMSLQVGTGYNTRTTFKNFVQGSRGSLDFLGFDDGSRKLPEAYAAIKDHYLSTDLVSDEQRVAASQAFPNTFGIYHRYNAAPNANLQFTMGNTKNRSDNSKFGYIFSANYRNGSEILTRQRNDYAHSKDPISQFNDNIYQSTNSSGALLNLSYSSGNNKFSFKNFYSNSFANNYTDRIGFYNESGVVSNIKSNETEVSQNGLVNSVLEGQHFLEKSKISIDYNVSFGLSYRNQPDQRILQIQRELNGEEYFLKLSNSSNPLIAHDGRVYSKLNEDIYGAKFNISKPYQLFGQTNKIKLGFLTSYRDRTFDTDALGYASQNPSGITISFTNGVTPENVFAPSNLRDKGIILSTISANSFGYDGTGFLTAGYLQSENKFGEDWRLIIGARIENYDQNIIPSDISNPKQTYSNLDVLPSANLTYSVTDQSNLRFSASRTVNRPEFRELATYGYYDFVTDYTIRGNPDLQRALITNVDLRYELFPSPGQIFSVSAFYKNFDHAIEQTNGGNRDFTYANANKATDLGAEIEFRKKLDAVTQATFVKNFTFYANASYIKSKVDVTDGNANRPLQGQSPYLLNGGLQFENDKGDFIVNALYNRIGPRLVFVNKAGGYDTYERPRDQVDLQLSKKLLKSKAEIKLNIADILAQKQQLYYNVDSKSAYSSSADKIVQSTLLGRTISLSFNYNF